MRKKLCIPVLSLLLLTGNIYAQPCTTLGQNPHTAFPVCGTSVFIQGTVPFCGDVPVPSPCVGSLLTDKNPFWYKFTCFSSGTLGFVITPNDATEDYDWQIFDVTGRNPADVYTDPSLFVSCNWSGETNIPPFGDPLGETGTSNNPIYPVFGCDGAGVYTFSQMPNLVAGRNYLLLVSHFSNTPNGYALSFGGGTAVITDPVPPQLFSANASCDGTQVFVKLNKNMKCSSLAPDGSDFSINPPGGATITGAVGIGCLTSFDMDSVVVTLNQPLPPGNYDLVMQAGTDANTLLDNCDNGVPVGYLVPFTVVAVAPTPMDSLTTPACAPNTLELVFNNPIRCSSIAPDGSDFNISGTYAVSVVSAAGNTCINGLTDRISIQLGAAMQQQGNFQVTLQVGSDGNTLLNDCGAATPAGEFLPFVTSDTVNAAIGYTVTYGCHIATVDFSHAGGNGVNSWAWTFEDGSVSALQNPQKVYNIFGNKQASLTVSNGVCNAATVLDYVITDNSIQPFADFLMPVVCVTDPPAQFTDNSTPVGSIATWAWDFGDPPSGPLNNSNLQNPQHQYTVPGIYPVTLTVADATGCISTLQQFLTVNGGVILADFNTLNPANLCANDSIAIQDASSVTPGNITRVDIYWDNIGQPAVFVTDNSPTPNEIYKTLYPDFQAPLTRNYEIRYRAYSGATCVADAVKTITVNASPLIHFKAMADVCYDAAPFQITDASEIGGVPGTPTYSGPGVSPTGIFSPAIAGIGTHTILFTWTATAGGCIDTASNTITVLDTATAKFSYSSPVCEGNPVSFTDESITAPGGSLNNTVWNFGDGSPLESHPPGATFTHQFPSAGNYTVTMYNTTDDGCRSTNYTRSVTVSPVPVPGFVVDKPLYCVPHATVIFSSTSTIADGTEASFTYLWNFDDLASGGNNQSTAMSPSHTFSTAGPFNVSLTVRSGAGCEASIIIPLTTVHPQPRADFSTDLPGTCIGGEVTFTDLSDPMDGTTASWNWNMGDGTIRNTPTVVHLYNDTLTYPVSLYIVNSYGCHSDTIIKPFTVYAFPVVSAGPDRFVLEGGSLIIRPTTQRSTWQYQWAPPLYLNNSSIATPTCVKPETDMTYALTVTAPGGCQSTDEMFVKLLKTPRIPNTFTPNNDGINDLWDIAYLKDYPNNHVQVFTRAGQLVFEHRGNYQPWNGTMDGKTLPFDTYYYIIEPGHGREPITGYVTIIK